MKLIFNDATELTIQSAKIRVDGSILIKTISTTEEELREIFSDNLRTQKMVTKERESTVAEYEGYTTLNAIVKYTAGIIGVVLYKPRKTPQERMNALEEVLKNATQTIDSEGNLTDHGKLTLFASAIEVADKPVEDGVELPPKEGHKWEQRCQIQNGTPRISWELVEDPDYIKINDGTDYTKPVVWKAGMSVTTGLWYTDGENVWEAIKDGVPASLEDKEYFDIKEA
ncbi:hypothetical protein [Dorea amylophila]|uniref:hypothetical protein n=1 Tax=Dorea amylophila TaxID=2981789 RepID=UPI0022DFC4AC|nr:hypothetical protein [Dorea amylophila]